MPENSGIVLRPKILYSKRGLSREETVETFKLPERYASLGMQEMALKMNVGRAYDQIP